MPKHRWEVEIRPHEHMGSPGATEGSGVTYGLFVDAAPQRPVKVWTEDDGVVIVGGDWGAGTAALTPRSPSNHDAHVVLTAPTHFASTVPTPVVLHCERADRAKSPRNLQAEHEAHVRAVHVALDDPAPGSMLEKLAKVRRAA